MGSQRGSGSRCCRLGAVPAVPVHWLWVSFGLVRRAWQLTGVAGSPGLLLDGKGVGGLVDGRQAGRMGTDGNSEDRWAQRARALTATGRFTMFGVGL